LVDVQVAVNWVITAPLAAPAPKLTFSPPVALEAGVERARTAVGMDAVPTVTGFEIVAGPLPTLFVAATANV
jgi:hypothetical protein